MVKTDLRNRERTLEAKIRLPNPTSSNRPSGRERGVRGPANCFQRQNNRYTENTALASRQFVERWLLVRINQKGNVGQLDVADTEVVRDRDANAHRSTGHAVGLRADVMNCQAETDSFRFTDSRSTEPGIDNIACPRAIDFQGHEKIAALDMHRHRRDLFPNDALVWKLAQRAKQRPNVLGIFCIRPFGKHGIYFGQCFAELATSEVQSGEH